MKSKVVTGLAGAVALMGAGAGAFAVAQDGTPGDERAVAERVEVGPVVAREKGSVMRTKGKAGPKIVTYFARNATVPPEGGGQVVELKCPKKAGGAISGGALTSEGIIVGYLSKGSPSGDISARSYYVGVDDNSSAPEQAGAGAIAEVHCAKGIKTG